MERWLGMPVRRRLRLPHLTLHFTCSYNVPPYGRSGLYLELSTLKDLIGEYRSRTDDADEALCATIYETAVSTGIVSDVPLEGIELHDDSALIAAIANGEFAAWLSEVSKYLVELQDRLFSSGLRYVLLR